jgi:hypothetical protein
MRTNSGFRRAREDTAYGGQHIPPGARALRSLMGTDRIAPDVETEWRTVPQYSAFTKSGNDRTL